MKRGVVLAGFALLGALYCAVVLWLVLTGDPGHMMAGAILAAAPLVVAAQQTLKVAAAEREGIVEEVRALRDEIRELRDAIFR